MALGLEKVGFTPTLLIEPDVDARRTLRTNRNWPVAPRLEIGATESLANDGVGLLVGNLPSAGISIAGPSYASTDIGEYAQVLDLIGVINPSAVLLVNVAGLMQRRFFDLRRRIDARLGEHGYQSSWNVIDSAHYGLPQARRRAVLVAIQSSAFSRFVWPTADTDPPTVGEFLLPQMSAKGWSGAGQWARLARGVAPTIVGGSKRHGGADLGPSRTKDIWYSLGVDGRGVADDPPAQDLPMRAMPRLTNGMLATLQGFPDEWTFVGQKTSVYRQIAGAFPAPTASVIGREIWAALYPE